MVVDNLNNAFYTTPEEDIDEIIKWCSENKIIAAFYKIEKGAAVRRNALTGTYDIDYNYTLMSGDHYIIIISDLNDITAFKLRWL